MKVLILSISAGGGHIHAAESIKNYTIMNDPHSDVKVIDTIKYINPIIDKVVIGGYLKSIKYSPSIFGKLYYMTEKDDSLSNVSNMINEALSNKILPLIIDFKPDIIVSTHPFPTEMLSILKSRNKINIPCICVMTDFAPHNFWIHPFIDAYVVSNSDMIEEMAERGVDRNIIYDYGIPVTPEFLKHYDKKETLNELNLSDDKTTLLVMGGSLGLGKISKIYEELNELYKDIQIIVITGNNKKLYSELIKLQELSFKQTCIIGYTNNVNKYMQASDLLLTKPGGLTISEALISATPLAIFSPLPGQEEKNAEFLLRHNLAVDLGNGKNCHQIVENLLYDNSMLSLMKANCTKYAKPNSGNQIYKLMCSITKNNNLIALKKQQSS